MSEGQIEPAFACRQASEGQEQQEIKSMSKLKNVFSMIKTPYFLKNLAGVLLFLVGAFGLLFLWLNFYTMHGKSIQVPDFTDMELVDARTIAKSNHVTLVISDSMFLRDKPPGVVLSQKPEKGASVKKGRKIYLAVTKFTPDMVVLPKVFGVSEDYRQYAKKLKRLGVSTKVKKEVYNHRLSGGTILKVYYKGKDISDKIEKGVKIPVGSTLAFVVSRRSSDFVKVPDLACLPEDEAISLLELNDLKIGNVEKLPGRTASDSYIVKQSPYPGKTLHTGGKVSITVGTKAAAGCN